MNVLRRGLVKNTIGRWTGLHRAIGQTHDLPYKIEGVSSEMNAVNHRAITEIMGDTLLTKDSINGFTKAYESILDAMIEKDYGFISGVCEPLLAQHIENALKKIERDGNVLRKASISETSDQYKVSFNKVRLLTGREFNRLEGKVPTQWIKNDFMDIGFSMPDLQKQAMSGGTGFSTKIIFSITVILEIETNLNLELAGNVTGLPLQKALPLTTHRLEFGVPSQLELTMTKTMEMATKMTLGKSDPKKLWNYFLEQLLKEDYSWQLLDIDDHFKSKEK